MQIYKDMQNKRTLPQSYTALNCVCHCNHIRTVCYRGFASASVIWAHIRFESYTPSVFMRTVPPQIPFAIKSIRTSSNPTVKRDDNADIKRYSANVSSCNYQPFVIH